MTQRDINKEVLARYGKAHQTFVAIEEMSELTKELTKDMRGNGNRENIIEEMADVYICLNQIKLLHNISLTEVVDAMNGKLKRTEERLNEEMLDG